MIENTSFPGPTGRGFRLPLGSQQCGISGAVTQEISERIDGAPITAGRIYYSIHSIGAYYFGLSTTHLASMEPVMTACQRVRQKMRKFLCYALVTWANRFKSWRKKINESLQCTEFFFEFTNPFCAPKTGEFQRSIFSELIWLKTITFLTCNNGLIDLPHRLLSNVLHRINQNLIEILKSG